MYRRHEQAEEYFNVTAAQFPTADASRCTSFAFPTSRNGRHTLTVRSADWAVTNVHVESGPGSVDRHERSQQLHHLSRLHEHDADKLHLLCGDFNARPGEDQCLLSEGWRGTRAAAPSGEDWTWRAGSNRARYDRVFIHNSNSARGRCLRIERLDTVWGTMTDHVALHAVVCIVPYAFPPHDVSCAPEVANVEAGPVQTACGASASCKDLPGQPSGIPARSSSISGVRPLRCEWWPLQVLWALRPCVSGS